MLLVFIIHKFPYSQIHESHFIDLRNISTCTKTEEILFKYNTSEQAVYSAVLPPSLTVIFKSTEETEEY